MTEVARALGAAHALGLVHRDVKPENVMVRSDGVVKVVDFGIAKRVRVDVGSSSIIEDARTQSIQGGIVGTPWYLSPEQLRGDAVDGRSRWCAPPWMGARRYSPSRCHRPRSACSPI